MKKFKPFKKNSTAQSTADHPALGYYKSLGENFDPAEFREHWRAPPAGLSYNVMIEMLHITGRAVWDMPRENKFAARAIIKEHFDEWFSALVKTDPPLNPGTVAVILQYIANLKIHISEDVALVLASSINHVTEKFNLKFSNMALSGCAALGIHPGNTFIKNYFAHSMDEFSDFSAGNYKNCLWSLGKLGIDTPAEWLGAWVEESHKRMEILTLPDLAGFVWALAIQDFLAPKPELKIIAQNFCGMMLIKDRSNFQDNNVMQIIQACAWFDLPLPFPMSVMPDTTREVPELIDGLKSAFKQAGAPVKDKPLLFQSGHSANIWFIENEKRIAVYMDRRSDFLINIPDKYTGRALFQQALDQKLDKDISVLHVPSRSVKDFLLMDRAAQQLISSSILDVAKNALPAQHILLHLMRLSPCLQLSFPR